MTHKIAIINKKGGVGKTTIAANLAATAASLKTSSGNAVNRVLLIDMDPQGNASQYMGLSAMKRKKLGKEIEQKDLRIVLKDGGSLEDCIYVYSYKKWQDKEDEGTHIGECYNPKTREYEDRPYKLIEVPNLHIVPAYEDLDIDLDVDLFLYKLDVNLLRNKISEIESKYDWIFFDCPPTWNKISQSAAAAAGKYVVPVKPGLFEIAGVESLIVKTNILNEEQGKKHGFKVELLRVVMNNYQRNIGEHLNQAVEARHMLGQYLAETVLPLSVEAIHSLKRETPFVFMSELGKGMLKISFSALFKELELAVQNNKDREAPNA